MESIACRPPAKAGGLLVSPWLPAPAGMSVEDVGRALTYPGVELHTVKLPPVVVGPPDTPISAGRRICLAPARP